MSDLENPTFQKILTVVRDLWNKASDQSMGVVTDKLTKAPHQRDFKLPKLQFPGIGALPDASAHAKWRKMLDSYLSLTGIAMPKSTKPDEPSECDPVEQQWFKAILLLSLKGNPLSFVAQEMKRGTDILHVIHEQYSTPENKAQARLKLHNRIFNFSLS
jgi:hypothetical protein